MLIVGICGASGSGKSTLARRIRDALTCSCVILGQDGYYKSFPQLSFAQRERTNYDEPSIFDYDEMLSDVLALSRGEAITTKAYDYTQHLRADRPDLIRPPEVLILEGIHMFHDKRLCELMVLKVFLQVDADICLLRRIRRDIKQRGRTIDNIAAQYLYVKNNPNADVAPKTYIFGAKAAPGYYLAKQIIRLICVLQKEIENDPLLRQKLRIVYLEDYRVTLSELLTPACDVSEQISLAGTEASGTGNMKLMLGGAITLGTYDGANVEIHEQVGDENIVIFGMRTEEVNAMRQRGYAPGEYYQKDPLIRDLIDTLYAGISGNKFPEIADSLKNTDPYMVLADFRAYLEAQEKIQQLYRQPDVWHRMSLMNIAGSGVFCADRAVEEYAQRIWRLTK